LTLTFLAVYVFMLPKKGEAPKYDVDLFTGHPSRETSKEAPFRVYEDADLKSMG
jgi:hypothetical protein